jgi:Rrf2 family protein
MILFYARDPLAYFNCICYSYSMATNTQFSIAVHVMAGLGARAGAGVQSRYLADSVNACPSFVRRVLSKLSKADLVRTTTGKTGACALARDPREISLLDIYRAVEAPKVFAIHAYEIQQKCAVSCGIKTSLERVLDGSQRAMEANLKKITLAEVLADIK